MPLRYSDIEWNDEAVVWYITCRSIDLTSEKNPEKPIIYEADDEVQDMCDDLKDEVAKVIKKPIKNLEAVSFAVKVSPCGIHFYIKAGTSNKEYIHLRVHHPYSYSGEEPKLEKVLANQGKEKPLTYF